MLLSIFERSFKLIDNEKLPSLLTLVDKFYKNLKSQYVIQYDGIANGFRHKS